MRKRLAIVAGLTAMMAAGGAVIAAPASAGPNCASGYHCVYFSSINSARHSYFNSDTDFTNDTFNQDNVNGVGKGVTVNNEVYSASNSSSGGYESHFYDSVGGTSFLFCLNPGHYVNYGSTNDQAGTQSGDPLPTGLVGRASALRLKGTTSVDCF